ncbi:MAG: sulfate/thiosulfate ABC transporter permease CysW, partial [Methylocystis sp.]|nr:sulfate/thiosulfate ABC transporter permease CysW [Methylocystis sp.]
MSEIAVTSSGSGRGVKFRPVTHDTSLARYAL